MFRFIFLLIFYNNLFTFFVLGVIINVYIIFYLFIFRGFKMQNFEKVNIRGVYFDNLTKEEAANRLIELLNRPGTDSVYTPNPEIVQACIEDNSLYGVINSASLVIPDGIGIIYASKILKTPLKEKIPGIELAQSLIEHISKTHEPIYLLGSAPASGTSEAVCDIAAKKLSAKYPGLVVCGTHDGYFKDCDSEKIIEDINNSGAKVLFVCLGAPKQEKWIYENRDKLSASLVMGLGGSLDVFAGTVKRAPNFFVKLNLEWFYRLVKQPQRFGRMLKLPKFLFGTIISKK